MPKYVDVAHLKAMKVDGVTIDLSDYSDNEIGDKIDVAEEIVDRITGDLFNGVLKTEALDGSGLSRQFFIPEVIRKLLEITTVKDLDLDGTILQTYVENTDFKRYDYYLESNLSVDQNVRRVVGSGGMWPRGQKNIEIVGYWGYAPAISGVGTVVVSAVTGLKVVTGTSTRFLRDFAPGNLIEIDGFWYTIDTITSDTVAAITIDFTGSTPTGSIAYNYFRVPPDIKQAVMLLSAEMLEGGSTLVTDGDAKQIVWSDFTLTLKGTASDVGSATGFPEIDRLLVNYINYGATFLVIPDRVGSFDRRTAF
jgi:hypothetical protein